MPQKPSLSRRTTCFTWLPISDGAATSRHRGGTRCRRGTRTSCAKLEFRDEKESSRQWLPLYPGYARAMSTLPTQEPSCVDPADARAIDLVIEGRPRDV